MIFTELIEPRPDDYNAGGNLSLESILKIFENTGNHHSQKVSDNAAGSNIAWILADWRVQITRRPKTGEKLNVSTWVYGRVPGGAAFRDFIISDAGGSECIVASSRWGLMNIAENKLVRISAELMDSYGPEEKTVFKDSLPRLRENADFDYENPIALRRSDIDFNGHVHNTRYLDFALDALPQDVYARDSFSSIRIMYCSALKSSDLPVIRTSRTEDGFLLSIYADKRLCTLIELK